MAWIGLGIEIKEKEVQRDSRSEYCKVVWTVGEDEGQKTQQKAYIEWKWMGPGEEMD